jgi:hypothetical protein
MEKREEWIEDEVIKARGITRHDKTNNVGGTDGRLKIVCV